MRVLSVALWLPYPTDHPVKRRTWHLLEPLAAAADVTLVTWADDTVAPEHIEHVRERVSELVLLRRSALPRTLLGRLAREARAQTRGLPGFVQVLRAEREPVPSLEGPFDAVVCEDEAALFLAPPVAGPRIVHRLNSLHETIGELSRCDTFPPVRRMKWKAEARMWGRYEREISSRADLSLAVSDELAAALRALSPGARFDVVPQGVQLPGRTVRPGPTPTCVFLGTMNYDPNVDSVRWLVRDIWPAIRGAVPDAELRIVGRSPHPSVTALDGRDGIRVLGEVPDIVAACDGGWVAVSPLRAGWGVKTKSIELMAMGLPLVSTTRGAEGLVAGAGLVVENDPAGFAAAAIRLLRDRAAATAAGEAARSYAAGALPWDAPPVRYIELLRSMLEGAEDSAGRGEGF